MGVGCGGSGQRAEKRPLAWSVRPLNGDIHWSQEMVACDGAFVVVGTTPDASSLYALDAGTGAVRWRVQAPLVLEALAAADGVVVAGGGGRAGALWVCVDVKTGAERWRSTSVGFGVPTVGDGNAYIYADEADGTQRIHALGLADGRERWSAAGSFGYHTASSNGAVYAITDDKRATAVAADTGAKLWAADRGASPRSRIITSADGRTLYSMASDGGSVLAYDTASGRTRWTAPTRALGVASMAAVGPSLTVMTTRGVLILDAATGTRRAEVETADRPGDQTLFSAHGLVYAYTGDAGSVGAESHGRLEAIDPVACASRWNVNTRTCAASSLCATADTVCAATKDSVLDAYTPDTGRLRWTADLPDDASVMSNAPRVYTDGKICTAGDRVYAFSA
ncbi:hypothetical protein GCM10023205_71640 [Yinghuangia aomiensis]|uniref:Pyrrolo-quinoline quinone repeat domain-containing protein n=1 Tax=Yinghuangia aomiensis TaxID=676205 RepID=A0ABP9I6R9_9ACTN